MGPSVDVITPSATMPSDVNGSSFRATKAEPSLAPGGSSPDEETAYRIPPDNVADYGVDSRDLNTPDKWIPRYPELIRLTGKHPFNSEPPLTKLVDHGFITPTSLHYVRNHGYVPQCDWDNWRIEIGGLVSSPTSISMAELTSMPSRTLPVTLVCVGNRRKEQNMVKKTRGFNWGAAGVSTSVWKGTPLRDVLERCGILPAHQGARFVCFEGEETLPSAGGTKYGTSIARSRAMDPSQDVILAYEQNGERLRPDHGFPVRVIIPGFIGGRMVKWLRKIEVTLEESKLYYHYYDNRVLPSFVDSERADREKWWYKPEYICNELSINSAASAPAHNEELPLNPTTMRQQYLLKGYAYSGGGRKVTRVEVTLDDGLTWRLAELVHPEQPTEYGKWWCWCFWSLRVDVPDLLTCKELAVRAWDEATNTQPEHLIWNVLGMMNNCWFRIRVMPTRTTDGLSLRFEHPTIAGPEPGGWMDPSVAEPKPTLPTPTTASAALAQGVVTKGKEAKQVAAPVKAAPAAAAVAAAPVANGLVVAAEEGLRRISMAEVARHDTRASPWIVVHGQVYDCTRFLEDHPGGADSILINAGTDVTEEFDAIHSRAAKAMLADYLIGIVADVNDPPAPIHAPLRDGVVGPTARPVTLDPKQRVPVRLVEKVPLSRDVLRLRFALPSEEHVLGLPIGKHMMLAARVGGSLVMRAYTPTSSDEDVGFFELVVKVYFRNVHPQFPDGGLMSQHLDSLKIGDTVEVKGPIGHIEYRGRGVFTADGVEHSARRIAMLAGGTGITPMYQVAKAVLRDPEDKTEMWLIFANRTAEDVLLKDELDAWAATDPRFHIWYTIESPGPEGWKFSTGRVNKEMMASHLPPAGSDSVAFLCGPPGMIKFGCIPNLESLGYASDRTFTF